MASASDQLGSSRHEVSDKAEVIEFYYSKGWTDGLPVVPPTEGSIREMLDAVGVDPLDEVVFIEHRQVSVTAEKVAINAVMAGCKPEYMPVIVATLEAMADPRWGFHGPATSTGGAAVLMLINGPITRELGINWGEDLFGPGWRANATIGRAVGSIGAPWDMAESTPFASPRTRKKVRGLRSMWNGVSDPTRAR